ncbi:hypothetical protein [Abditibacterium utsteinense]|nr:hypothetical protein [Abditibacterium utsteinense]
MPFFETPLHFLWKELCALQKINIDSVAEPLNSAPVVETSLWLLSERHFPFKLPLLYMPRLSSLYALAALTFCAAAPLSDAFAAPSNSRSTLSAFKPRTAGALGALGRWRAKSSPVRVRLLPPTSFQHSVQGTRVVSATGQLAFNFDKNKYSAGQINVLSSVVRASYSRLVSIYGEPADEQKGKTITVTDDGVSSAYAPKLNPDAKDGGKILFHYDNGSSAETNQYNFTRSVFLAFQGPNNFSYNFANGDYVEAWQLGMADAAALLFLYQGLSDADKAAFDPSFYVPIYALPVYDLFNRPELGNAYIYPRVAIDQNSRMGDFRAAMAQSAWLKVAIEKPSFFKDFNMAYRAQVGARQAATPNQLRAIAAAVVPQVEGLSFGDWVRRQYVLDNTITVGDKIYAAIVPVPVATQTNEAAGFGVLLEAFHTDKDGDEKRLPGNGTVDAFDENGININAKSFKLNDSNLFDVNIDRFDVGFNNLGNPNRARVTLKFRFKGAQTTAFFPFIGAGSANASKATIYGVSQNGESGSVAISGGVPGETVAVSRGVFAATQNYVGGPRVVSTLTLGGRTFKRNTAWLPGGYRGVAFVLDGATKNDKFTLTTAAGASKTRMISLPVFPTQSDEAEILGFAAQQLKLAKYRPNLSPSTSKTDANGNKILTFGIGVGEYEIYPNISAPMAPGRGYWLGVSDYRRDIGGSEPRTDKPFEIALPGGWNQFGVPFNRAFAPASIQVRYGSFAPIPYGEAVASGLIAPGIWRWQPRGGYARVDTDPNAKLAPFEGFYIFAIPARGLSLVFDPRAGSQARTASTPKDGWSVALAASTNAARDASNHFGISGREAAAKPPVAAPVVTLHFASSGNAASDAGGAGNATGWADSFFVEMAREARWNFSVDGTKRGERVALSWDDLKAVPADVKLVLRDEKLKKNLALFKGGSYKWSSDGAPRQFSVAATRVASAALLIAKAPSNQVSIAVALNLEARGRLEIQTLSGDTVFVLKDGTFAAKTEKFVWNGKRNAFQNAPRGRYRAVWIAATRGDRGAAREFNWR